MSLIELLVETYFAITDIMVFSKRRKQRNKKKKEK